MGLVLNQINLKNFFWYGLPCIFVWTLYCSIEKIPNDVFFKTMEYIVPNLLGPTHPEEMLFQEKLLLPYTYVCVKWKKTLEQRFDLDRMKVLFLDVYGWPGERFLTEYIKRIEFLKRHSCDSTWIAQQEAQISASKVFMLGLNLKTAIQNPAMFSYMYQVYLQNDLAEFKSQASQKVSCHLDNCGFISRSLFEVLFKYMYPTPYEVALHVFSDTRKNQLDIFYKLGAYCNQALFLQKKLLHMLKRKQYITDVIAGDKHYIADKKRLIDYRSFLLNFLNEYKEIQHEKLYESLDDKAVMSSFFEEYKAIFTKNDITDKSLFYYILLFLTRFKNKNSLLDLLVSFSKCIICNDREGFSFYSPLKSHQDETLSLFKECLPIFAHYFNTEWQKNFLPKIGFFLKS